MSDKAAPNGAEQHERNTIIVEDEVLRHGFTQIPNLLLRRNDISPGAKLTYMVLLSYAWQTDSCFPGHDRLASDMGVAKRSIVTYLQQLSDRGLIRVERRGLGQTNVYRLPRFSELRPQPRSAEFAPLEVQKTTHQEVPNLHPKKYTGEEDSKEKGLDPSNIRKRSSKKKNEVDEHKHRSGGEQLASGSYDDTTMYQEHTPAPSLIQPVIKPTSASGGVERPRRVPTSVADVLSARSTKPPSEGRQTTQRRYSEERQQLLAFIRDFATEFRDEAPLSSSVSRAYNLYTRSGIPLEAFCSFMYEARSLTQEYTANIKKRRGGTPGAFGPEQNKMPYFFSILEDLANQHAPSPSAPAPDTVPVESGDSRPVRNSEGQQHGGDRQVVRNESEAVPVPRRVPRRPVSRTVTPSVGIATFIKDVSEEWGQRTVARDDHVQAQTLYTQSGLAEDSFLQVLDVVRTLTQSARTEIGEERMPIFFRVLREQLGLPDSPELLDEDAITRSLEVSEQGL